MSHPVYMFINWIMQGLGVQQSNALSDTLNKRVHYKQLPILL